MSQIYVTKFGLRCSVARTRSKFFDARKKMRGCAAHTWRFLAKPVEHCRVYLEIHIAFRKPGSAGEQNHVTKRNFRHVKGVYSSDILSCRKWHISRQPGYLGTRYCSYCSPRERYWNRFRFVSPCDPGGLPRQQGLTTLGKFRCVLIALLFEE